MLQKDFKELIQIEPNEKLNIDAINAQILRTILVTSLIISFGATIITIFSSMLDIFLMATTLFISTTIFWNIQTKYPKACAQILSLSILIGTNTLILVDDQGIHDTAIILYPLLIFFSSITLTRAQLLVVILSTLLSVLGIGIYTSDVAREIAPSIPPSIDLMLLLLLLTGFTLFSWYISSSFKNILSTLKIKEENFNTIFNVSHDALILYDIDSQKIVDSNKTLYTLFGLTDNNLPTSPIQLCSDQSRVARSRLHRHAQRALRGKQQVFFCPAKYNPSIQLTITLQKIVLQQRPYLFAEIRPSQ